MFRLKRFCVVKIYDRFYTSLLLSTVQISRRMSMIGTAHGGEAGREGMSLDHLKLVSSRVGAVRGLVGLRNDGRRLSDLLSEDVSLKEIGQPHRYLILEEFLRRDGEDLCRAMCQRRRFT